MTIETLRQIFRQIVADTVYNPGKQINSFVFVDEAPALDHESFGASYVDFVDGVFYARTWVNQGADPNTIRGEHPVLFVEDTQSEVEDLDDPSQKTTISFLVIDKIPCESCPPNIRRTGNTVLQNTLLMLRAFLERLYTYELYEVDRDGNITYEWATPDWIEQDETIDAFSSIDDIKGYIMPGPYTFARWGRFGMMGMAEKRAYYTSLMFDLCQDDDTEYSPTPIVSGIAKINCPC